MVKVKALAFTGYPVTDMVHARAFYEGVFNLKSTVSFEHEGKYWIEYDLGDSTFALANMNDQWKPAADGPMVAFEVEDFDATVAALRARSTRFAVEPMDSGVCRMAIVIDPSGNSLCVHRRHKS
ncbi:MAG TPA: VOC family protein [Candidatus Didemnitutus sp.]|nr:VOC family protein [Candidatus Didemnitutus sp.]